MRKLPQLITTIFVSSLLFSTSALAKPKFENTIEGEITGPIKVEVILSDDMVHRTTNLPKKISDRNGSRGLNSGFAGNGFYGEKSVNKLMDNVKKIVERRFERKGLNISDEASTIFRITVEDAKPNRPTFEQLSRQAGLSSRSFSTGGASFNAEMVTAGGESLGTMSYRYYDTDIREASFGVATWDDAKKSASFFARKAAKALN